jgi:hypothetical protein
MIFHGMSGTFMERALGDDFSLMHQVMLTNKDKTALRYFLNALAEDDSMFKEASRAVFLKSQYTIRDNPKLRLNEYLKNIVEVKPTSEISIHNFGKGTENLDLNNFARLCQFNTDRMRSGKEMERKIKALTSAAYDSAGVLELAAFMCYFPFLVHFFGNIAAIGTEFRDKEGSLWVPVASSFKKKTIRLTYRKLDKDIQGVEPSMTFLATNIRPF